MEELKNNVKKYLEIINSKYKELDPNFVDFIIDETLDRISLYLNSETIPKKLEKIIAGVVNNGLSKFSTENLVINSLSDNGQSITFVNEVKKYFSTSNDEELFTGFTSLLNRYRRIKVVYPETNENGNN